ncbi:hypothetical protein MRX96_007500 [Rhipicephalus microplus]
MRLGTRTRGVSPKFRRRSGWLNRPTAAAARVAASLTRSSSPYRAHGSAYALCVIRGSSSSLAQKSTFLGPCPRREVDRSSFRVHGADLRWRGAAATDCRRHPGVAPGTSIYMCRLSLVASDGRWTL